MRNTICVCLAWALLTVGCVAGMDGVRVARVIDGDTFVTVKGERVRLAGVDAPELGQDGGEEARIWLQRAIGARTVELSRHGEDIYGRTLAVVRVNGRVVDIVGAGHGRVWR